jgi:putative Mg2+ transporter-C (MgtC) family protein
MEYIFSMLNEAHFFQLLISLLLGVSIGAERTRAGKNAGLRTYGLVSMGSCLFALIAIGVISYPGVTVSDADVMRVVAGVVTGIGFLGAGSIIMRGEELTGLTTAAGMWVSAGMGVAVAFELYSLAIVAAILTLVIFTLLWSFELKVFNKNDSIKGS